MSSYDPGKITATVTVTKAGNSLVAGPVSYHKTLLAGKEYHFDKNAAKKDNTFVNFISKSGGTNATVEVELMTWFQNNEFKLVQTSSPMGYYETRVGDVIFTVSLDGKITALDNDGFLGYAEPSADGTVVVIKNHTLSKRGSGSGGGSSSGGSKNSTTAVPGNPSVPAPTETSSAGPVEIKDANGNLVWSGQTADGYVDVKLDPGVYTVTVKDGSRSQTYDLDIKVPLSGLPGGSYVSGRVNTRGGYLAKNGDSGAELWMLLMTMMAAAGAFGTVLWIKRRAEMEA